MNQTKKKTRAQNAAEWLTGPVRKASYLAERGALPTRLAEAISHGAIWEAGGPQGTLPLHGSLRCTTRWRYTLLGVGCKSWLAT